MKHPFIVIVLALALFPAVPQAAGSGPADVVQAFNRALSARKIEDATALMARGAVQFTLRSAHPGVATTGPAGTTSVTGDLKTHWTTIGPVVFTVTTVYSRVPKILATRVDGDLATVWTQVASETVERNGQSRKDNFSEVYLMVRTGDTWQIGAIADNRGTDNMAVAPAAAAKPK